MRCLDGRTIESTAAHKVQDKSKHRSGRVAEEQAADNHTHLGQCSKPDQRILPQKQSPKIMAPIAFRYFLEKILVAPRLRNQTTN